MKVVSLESAFSTFDDHWHPRIAAELNGQYVKLAKIQGEFDWHKHDGEDELFLVVRGTMLLHLRDETLAVKAGEFVVVPRGVEHKPAAVEVCHIMLFEPKSTVNTGDNPSDRTRDNLDWIE